MDESGVICAIFYLGCCLIKENRDKGNIYNDPLICIQHTVRSIYICTQAHIFFLAVD